MVASCVQPEGYGGDFGGSAKSSEPTAPAHGFSKDQYQHLMILFHQAQLSPHFIPEGPVVKILPLQTLQVCLVVLFLLLMVIVYVHIHKQIEALGY